VLGGEFFCLHSISKEGADVRSEPQRAERLEPRPLSRYAESWFDLGIANASVPEPVRIRDCGRDDGASRAAIVEWASVTSRDDAQLLVSFVSDLVDRYRLPPRTSLPGFGLLEPLPTYLDAPRRRPDRICKPEVTGSSRCARVRSHLGPSLFDPRCAHRPMAPSAGVIPLPAGDESRPTPPQDPRSACKRSSRHPSIDLALWGDTT